MAVRKKMTADPRLPYIYNISQPIGFYQPNLPDDVQLLQVLFAIIVPRLGVGVLKPHPQVSGVFDTVTGFWVFQLQKMLNSEMDGIVSPVVGGDGYTAGKRWTLYGLNEVLMNSHAEQYKNLHEDARLGASLRQSIKPL